MFFFQVYFLETKIYYFICCVQGECQIESFAVRGRDVSRPHVPVAPMSLSEEETWEKEQTG